MASNETIGKIYLSFRSQLARAVSRLVPPHEIEDIVQETYVRLCRFKRKQDIQEPQALMLRVARNLAFDYLKRAEGRLTVSMDENWASSLNALARQVDQTYRQVACDEEFSQFCEAVRQLPQQCRRVFVLKKVYGYSQKEIATELQLSESTVEKHIAKGMKLCTNYVLQHATDLNAVAPSLRRAASGPRTRR